MYLLIKETIMSTEASRQNRILDTAQASLRNHLGEFADLFMQAKIQLLRKISDRIAAASTEEELAKLRKELHDSFLSEEDIADMEAKTTKFFNLVESNIDRLLAIKAKTRQGTTHH